MLTAWSVFLRWKILKENNSTCQLAKTIAEKVRKYPSNLLDPCFFITGTYLVKLDIFYGRYRRMQGKVCLWNCGKMWKYARNVWLHLSSRLPLCWRNEGMPRLTTKNPLVNSIWNPHFNFFFPIAVFSTGKCTLEWWLSNFPNLWNTKFRSNIVHSLQFSAYRGVQWGCEMLNKELIVQPKRKTFVQNWYS